MGFLSDQNALYGKEFGFPKNVSTAHEVISLIENIEKAIDNKLFAYGIFVDLQEAFNTIDQNILTHKLSHYGTAICKNKWI